jgi:hypothetical protein
VIAPNPVRSRATIPFALTAPSAVDLAVFDVQGRRVATILKQDPRPAGAQAVEIRAEARQTREQVGPLLALQLHHDPVHAGLVIEPLSGAHHRLVARVAQRLEPHDSPGLKEGSGHHEADHGEDASAKAHKSISPESSAPADQA